MKKFTLLICSIIALILVLYSCSNTEKFTLNTIDIDYVNKSDITLNGEELQIKAKNIRNIFLKDSIFIVQVNDNEHLLEIYKYPSFSHITDICRRGRARNEFINTPTNMTKQLYYDKGNLIFPLVDDDAHFKEVNITESINRQSAVIQSSNECLDFNDGQFIICNEGVKYIFNNYYAMYDEMDKKKTFSPKYEYVENGKTKIKINVFPSLCNTFLPMNAIGAYSGVMFKHPNRNLIIQPMEYLNYILFFDLDNSNYFAIHQIGTSTYEDKTVELSKNLCFTTTALTDDYFMVLYWSGDKNRTTTDKVTPELLVFNWSGVFLGSAKLDKRVKYIVYDENSHRLIGLDGRDDSLYSFDLSAFIKSIGL